MALSNVVQKLTSFLQTKMNQVLAPIPAIMLICSAIKRPGLSAMLITSRIINRQQDFGAPVGVNIDGSPNLMNQMFFVVVDELVKALKLEGKVEIGVPIGGITSVGWGANGGGMMQVISTNQNNFTANGIIR